MRCGLPAGSAAAVASPAVPSAVMPSPTAALPARKLRRFTAVLAKPAVGSQPAHPHKRGLRLSVLVITSLSLACPLMAAMVDAAAAAVKTFAAGGAVE